MFYRAADDNNGNGLGLFIVKNAVDKLGGSILLKSKPNVGTIITISIPKKGNIVKLKIQDEDDSDDLKVLVS